MKQYIPTYFPMSLHEEAKPRMYVSKKRLTQKPQMLSEALELEPVMNSRMGGGWGLTCELPISMDTGSFHLFLLGFYGESELQIS